MFIDFLVRLAPGAALAVLVFVLVKPSPVARIGVYIFLFVLLRDAMTPSGLWTFGGKYLIWVRFTTEHLPLLLMALSSAGAVVCMHLLDRENANLVSWFRGNRLFGIGSGLVAGAIILIPAVIGYRSIPIGARGGLVPSGALPLLAVFALCGNLLEEYLFRGHVLGHLEKKHSSLRAGVESGIIFALCHVFLATTVTSVGVPLLLFVLWEGILCGIVASQFGLVASTIAHGGAIFVLASGWL